MNRIKELRKESNIEAYTLASKLNIAVRTLYNIEKDGSNISSNILINLSKVFNCSIDYILGLTSYRQVINKETVDNENMRNVISNLIL